MSVWDEKEVKISFKELPFYKAPIKKLYTKEFYKELSILKTSKSFKGYPQRYSIEIIDSKDPSVQLTLSRPSIKELFKDLLNEIKGFKYQIALNLLLTKYKKKKKKMQKENFLLLILILLLSQ